MKHLNRLTVRALAFAVAFAICLPAFAGRHHCNQLVVVKQVAVAVPVIYSTVSPYLYQESVDARIEKAVDRRLQALGITGAQQQKADAPSLMSQKCAGCHNGTKARSFAGGLTGDEYKSFSRMVGLGIYPEGAEAMKPVIERLKAEGKAGDVVAEILNMPDQPAARTEPEPGVLE